MLECRRCGSGFDNYRQAEAHAERHLVTVTLTLDGVECDRVVEALTSSANGYDALAKNRSNAGPARRGVRVRLRNFRNDYLLLAGQIRKAASS